MNLVSVITSINSPNKCTESIAKSILCNKLIVVADKKSPERYEQINCDYFDLKSQANSNFKLKDKIPFNHYARKNLGYLKAFEIGAECIYDTDDDNFLEKDFVNKNELFETKKFIKKNINNYYCNIYKFFTDKFIWPRGLPLDEIKSEVKFECTDIYSNCHIIQFLANGDTDVDAIYRLVFDENVKFNDGLSFCLDKLIFAPTNSQSTLFSKKAFPLLYLPITVSFRFTDILRGVVLKRIADLNNLKLGFKSPIAYQDRNKHDYMKDFGSETSMFLNLKRANKTLSNLVGSGSIVYDLLNAYKKLYEIDIVKEDEISSCEAWINDFNSLNV